MNENGVTQVTPNQGLALLCEKYEVSPEGVIFFCWQSVVLDFLQRGELDPEIVDNIRALEQELGEDEDEGNKILAVPR